MIKPAFVRPGEQVTIVGRVFGAPLVVKGLSWCRWPSWRPGRSWPGSPAAASPAQLGPGAGRGRPDHAGRAGLGVAAQPGPRRGRPAGRQTDGRHPDRVRYAAGCLSRYQRPGRDPPTAYRPGPGRTAVQRPAGPIRLAAPAALPVLDTIAYDLAETALATNIFLPTVGLLPIPFIDGGPVLKWSLVARGRTVPEADQAVRRVNVVLGLLLSLLGGLG